MHTSRVKAPYWSLVCAFGALVACAAGTQDLTGDLGLADADSGTPDTNDSDSGKKLSDDGGTAVKEKNPDAEAPISDDGGTTDPDGGEGTDAGTTQDSGTTTTTDASTCTVTTANLLKNGTLDNGDSPWNLSSSGVIELYDGTTDGLPVIPQSGLYAGWLGGYANAKDTLYQTVAIPATTTAVHLKGYRLIATSDSAGHDILSMQNRDTAGNKLEELVSLSPSAAASDTDWVAFDYTWPTTHAGQSIQVAFVGTTNSSKNTNFFLDTLSLSVTYCK